MAYDPPLKICIPLPSPIPRARGHRSTTGYGGNLRIRCTDEEYTLVQNEASELGLPLAAFSRWCIVYAANALKEHRDAGSSSPTTGEPPNDIATG
tara:strand:- start:2033 stop:2317 length:285 start_codon:yes stop_codon:yes gene_type:complete